MVAAAAALLASSFLLSPELAASGGYISNIFQPILGVTLIIFSTMLALRGASVAVGFNYPEQYPRFASAFVRTKGLLYINLSILRTAALLWAWPAVLVLLLGRNGEKPSFPVQNMIVLSMLAILLWAIYKFPSRVRRMREIMAYGFTEIRDIGRPSFW